MNIRESAGEWTRESANKIVNFLLEAKPAKPIYAKHIDGGFYLLSQSQAKSLCIDNALPGPGRSKMIDKNKLNNVRLLRKQSGRWTEYAGEAQQAERAFIERTSLNHN